MHALTPRPCRVPARPHLPQAPLTCGLLFFFLFLLVPLGSCCCCSSSSSSLLPWSHSSFRSHHFCSGCRFLAASKPCSLQNQCTNVREAPCPPREGGGRRAAPSRCPAGWRAGAQGPRWRQTLEEIHILCFHGVHPLSEHNSRKHRGNGIICPPPNAVVLQPVPGFLPLRSAVDRPLSKHAAGQGGRWPGRLPVRLRSSDGTLPRHWILSGASHVTQFDVGAAFMGCA